MDTLIYLTLKLSFLLVAASTPLLVVMSSVKSYRLMNDDFEIIRFRAVVALAIWLFFTIPMTFILVVEIIISREKEFGGSDMHPTLGNIGIHLLYFAICYLLVDWIRNRGNIKLP